jgi:hypothetical protein
MAVYPFERASPGTTQRNDSSSVVGFLRRVFAAVTLPFVLGFMMMKPEWFEPDE